MLPLQVTFSLSTPVVLESEHPVHFDGVLAACVAREAEEMGSEDPWTDADDLSHLLERTEEDAQGNWVWKASQLVFEACTERFMQPLVRRSEPEEFMHAQDAGLFNSRRLRSSLPSGSGPDRSYFLYHSYQWMSSVTAHCIGDPVEIKNALRYVKSLGKMGRNGFGAIASVDVVVVEDSDAWMRRFLPTGHPGAAGAVYVPAMRRLRAPYWKKSDMAEVKMPVV